MPVGQPSPRHLCVCALMTTGCKVIELRSNSIVGQSVEYISATTRSRLASPLRMKMEDQNHRTNTDTHYNMPHACCYRNTLQHNSHETPSRLTWGAVKVLVSHVFHLHRRHPALRWYISRGAQHGLLPSQHTPEARSGEMGSFAANNRILQFA